MAWKRKEKPLTQQEAVDQARKELAPYWLHSEPLLAAVRASGGSKVVVHPLDPRFDESLWLVLLVDLASFAGDAALSLAREWLKKYSPQGLGLLVIANGPYRFMDTAKALEPFLGRDAAGFSVALDRDKAFFDAFDAADGLPKVLLLQNRKIVFSRAGRGWFEGSENEIQRFLRLSDPGLPLAPAMGTEGAQVFDSGRILLSGEGLRQVKLSGAWTREADRLVTRDPSAALGFVSPARGLSLVARAVVPEGGASRVVVELDGNPLSRGEAGLDLVLAEDGTSQLRVDDARIYRALDAQGGRPGEIRLRFPDADRLPVAVYGIQFGQ